MAQMVNASWSAYTAPTDKTLSGFKLYRDGILVCQTNVPTAKTMDCDVTFTKSVNDFTLSATFADNTESPHSPKYTFNWIPSPTNVKVEFK